MIVFSSSFQDFINNNLNNKVCKALNKLIHKGNYCNLFNYQKLNYITFRQDGTISFLPYGKEHKVNDSGEWQRDGRQNGKPAKVIRSLFTEKFLIKFKESDFEIFANSYKSHYALDSYTFELLPNTDIKRVYDTDRMDGDGSLNNSCMNGDLEYLDIYENCNQLQILTLKNDSGKLAGRALVWRLGDVTFVDRFYVCQDYMYNMFLNYAKSQKWMYKQDYKSYSNKDTFIFNGEIMQKTLKIYTDTDFDQYPYIDTFSFGGDGYLTNKHDIYEYCNTNGEREGGSEHEGEVWDDINECWIDEGDSCYIDSGERRFRDRIAHIDSCVYVNDSWYHEDDVNIVNIGGRYYENDSDEICQVNGEYELIKDCVYCERDSEWYLSDDCVYSEHSEDYILKSEAYEVNGEYYHEEDVQRCV